MLDKDELLHWCQRLKLSQEARNVIEQIRSSDPARRVQSGIRNVSGTYPSKKMNFTIQFESHRVELAAVYEMEHDADVIEYYDQPPSFKLEYAGMNGTITHPALGETPRSAFIDGLERTGRRPRRYIPYTDDFVMWTLPTTPKGAAKMLAGRVVKIHHIYYWSDVFRDPEIENTQVPVRYDPFEVGTA